MNALANKVRLAAVTVKRFWHEEDAPTAFEYALIVSGAAVVIGVAVGAFFMAVSRGFNTAAGAIR